MRSAIVALYAVFFATFCFAKNSAQADDQPFLTLNATDIEPELGHELEQNFGWNTGLSHRAFSELEGETEFEYGFSDQLQLAAATSYAWSYEHDHRAPPSPSESGSQWGGIRGEAIFQAMNVYFDPIGLGFLVGGGAGPSARSVEANILLQKDFLNTRLRFAINAGGEFGSEKDGTWSDVSALTLKAGLAYNITWDWSAGIELDAERDFDGLMLNGHAIPIASSCFIGPTIQYVAHPWTASLGFQTQLPWAKDFSHAAGAIENGYLADVERTRVAFRITRDFY